MGKYNTNNNRGNKNNAQRGEKQPYEPKITQGMKLILDMLEGQAQDFLFEQTKVDEMTMEERKQAENELFSIPGYPADFQAEGEDPLKMFMVERSVHVDRETHLLLRASCTIIAMNESGAPELYINAYLTKNGTGSIVIIPQSANGPVYRDVARVSFSGEKA